MTTQSGSFTLTLYSFYFFLLTNHTGNIRLVLFAGRRLQSTQRIGFSILFLHLIVEREVLNLERDRSETSKKKVWN